MHMLHGQRVGVGEQQASHSFTLIAWLPDDVARGEHKRVRNVSEYEMSRQCKCMCVLHRIGVEDFTDLYINSEYYMYL